MPSSDADEVVDESGDDDSSDMKVNDWRRGKKESFNLKSKAQKNALLGFKHILGTNLTRSQRKEIVNKTGLKWEKCYKWWYDQLKKQK